MYVDGSLLIEVVLRVVFRSVSDANTFGQKQTAYTFNIMCSYTYGN